MIQTAARSQQCVCSENSTAIKKASQSRRNIKPQRQEAGIDAHSTVEATTPTGMLYMNMIQTSSFNGFYFN